MQQPNRAGRLPRRADSNTASLKNAKCFQESGENPNTGGRWGLQACVRGRRPLAELTFACRSDQSAWPCGRSGSPKQPGLYPWYLPNRRHYINLAADTGYESTRRHTERPVFSPAPPSNFLPQITPLLVSTAREHFKLHKPIKVLSFMDYRTRSSLVKSFHMDQATFRSIKSS